MGRGGGLCARGVGTRGVRVGGQEERATKVCVWIYSLVNSSPFLLHTHCPTITGAVHPIFRQHRTYSICH